jgi:hypothetical protein
VLILVIAEEQAHPSHGRNQHFHRVCAHPSYVRRTGAVSGLILLMVGTNLFRRLCAHPSYRWNTGAVSRLILLMVGTNLFRRLCDHPSYSRRTGMVSGLILRMVGTNISAGYVLTIAGELGRLAGSSFSWQEPTLPQAMCSSFLWQANWRSEGAHPSHGRNQHFRKLCSSFLSLEYWRG